MRMAPIMVVLAASAVPGRAAEPVVAYTITDGREIAASLTGLPGDSERGWMSGRSGSGLSPRRC